MEAIKLGVFLKLLQLGICGLKHVKTRVLILCSFHIGSKLTYKSHIRAHAVL